MKVASTTVANVHVKSPVWQDYTVEQSVTLTTSLTSGIVNQNPTYNGYITQTGGVINVPFYKPLGGAGQLMNPGTAMSTKSADGKHMVSLPVIGRVDSYSFTDDVFYTTRNDPVEVLLGQQVGRLMAEARQASMFSILKGIEGASVSGKTGVTYESVVDITSDETGSSLSPKTIIKGKNKLGDQGDRLKVLLCHSDVYYNVVESQDIVYERSETLGSEMARWMGFTLVKHDQCPRTGEGTDASPYVYTSYMFDSGYMQLGTGMPKGGIVESDRSVLKLEDVFTWKDLFMMGPTGFSFNNTSGYTTIFPSNSDLEDSSNWTHVMDVKNTPLVILKSKG